MTNEFPSVYLSSQETATFQKWAFPFVAILFASSLLMSLDPVPLRALALFCAVIMLTVWWKIVLKYEIVLEDGADLIVGCGSGKVSVRKQDIQEVATVPFMRIRVFRVTARVKGGLFRFSFPAAPGVTKSRVLGGGDKPQQKV